MAFRDAWHGKMAFAAWFERFYGILVRACSYLRPEGERGLVLDNEKLPAPEAPYYTTDAFTDYAVNFINEQKDNTFSYI